MATVTIPAEFRELFDREARTTLEIVSDCEWSDEERGEAEALLTAIRLCKGAVSLTVPASGAALVTIGGCIGATWREIPCERTVNDPTNIREALAAIDRLRRWYSIAAEVPQGVRA